jgi:Uncharacterized protein conserved in bacteria
MYNIGSINKLTIKRKAEFGYFLDAETGNTNDDILIPAKDLEGKDLEIGSEIEVFIYKDSKDRPIATLRTPFAQVGDIAYLEVVAVTKIGAFVNFGLERDIFVPIKEQVYRLYVGRKYLFYIYLDKSNRIAATADIKRYLSFSEIHNIGDEVKGIVYEFQTNGSAEVAVEGLYKGVILKNEYFTDLKEGDELQLRVKKIYEDGRLGLTPRNNPKTERNLIEDQIYNYLIKNNGFMIYNDKSSPEDIRDVFNTSKNYFKNALGGLMKKGIITQDETGTKLIKKM